MMKLKRPPQNPLLYWWNEFLFARYFEYETDLSPEELAQSLRMLAHPRDGWIWGLLKTADVSIHPNGKGLAFDIQSKRKRALDIFGITTARAQGSTITDKQSGRLVVQGSVTLGRIFHLFLVIYVSFMLLIYVPLIIDAFAMMGNNESIFFLALPLLMIGAMFGFYWWRIYVDRNNLAAEIEAAILEEAAHHQAEGRLTYHDERAIEKVYKTGANDSHNHLKR
jgi:hypothetical protein